MIYLLFDSTAHLSIHLKVVLQYWMVPSLFHDCQQVNVIYISQDHFCIFIIQLSKIFANISSHSTSLCGGQYTVPTVNFMDNSHTLNAVRYIVSMFSF